MFIGVLYFKYYVQHIGGLIYDYDNF